MFESLIYFSPTPGGPNDFSRAVFNFSRNLFTDESTKVESVPYDCKLALDEMFPFIVNKVLNNTNYYMDNDKLYHEIFVYLHKTNTATDLILVQEFNDKFSTTSNNDINTYIDDTRVSVPVSSDPNLTVYLEGILKFLGTNTSYADFIYNMDSNYKKTPIVKTYIFNKMTLIGIKNILSLFKLDDLRANYLRNLAIYNTTNPQNAKLIAERMIYCDCILRMII